MVKHKLKYNRKGDHVHVHMFSREAPTATWAKNGRLTFDEEEWQQFRQIMRQSGKTALEEVDL